MEAGRETGVRVLRRVPHEPAMADSARRPVGTNGHRYQGGNQRTENNHPTHDITLPLLAARGDQCAKPQALCKLIVAITPLILYDMIYPIQRRNSCPEPK